jgi:hypothetical protein
MKPRLPGPERDRRLLLAVAFAAFGIDILLTFFLSSRILVFIEAAVIVAVASLCLSDR